MLVQEKLYSLSDVTIIPDVGSNIRHRSECNPYHDGMLPIFASPMDAVVNEYNFEMWINNKITPILPRTELIGDRLAWASQGRWVAFGLDEFEKYFVNSDCVVRSNNWNILIDIANGHIEALLDDIRKAKDIAYKHKRNLTIMAGNVANEYTFKYLALAGADYIRCSIGTGACCITSSNTAVHMPMASLIDKCRKIKEDNALECKIVADGGINSYANAIKALALGADYVMMGTTLAKCFESASEFIRTGNPYKDYVNYSLSTLNEKRYSNDEETKKTIIGKYSPMIKTIYGMSTRKAQRKIQRAQGKKEEDIRTKTSEGIEREIQVEYTIKQWVENFTDYLRSAMSYCNALNLKEFIGIPQLYILSEGAKQSINK